MWLAFALVSALFLGLYDVAKKQSLKENAVIPVLWFNTLFCSLLMLPFTLLSATTGLLDGSIHILIGTHAVIEDNVQFRNLGLIIIDEQHRFGVAQRAKLQKVNPHSSLLPHVLVMTATPICYG